MIDPTPGLEYVVVHNNFKEASVILVYMNDIYRIHMNPPQHQSIPQPLIIHHLATILIIWGTCNQYNYFQYFHDNAIVTMVSHKYSQLFIYLQQIAKYQMRLPSYAIHPLHLISLPLIKGPRDVTSA